MSVEFISVNSRVQENDILVYNTAWRSGGASYRFLRVVGFTKGNAPRVVRLKTVSSNYQQSMTESSCSAQPGEPYGATEEDGRGQPNAGAVKALRANKDGFYQYKQDGHYYSESLQQYDANAQYNCQHYEQ